MFQVAVRRTAQAASKTNFASGAAIHAAPKHAQKVNGGAGTTESGVPFAGIVGLAALGGGFAWHHIYQNTYGSSGEEGNLGLENGSSHPKVLRAWKKEEQPLTQIIGGKKDIDSHKHMRALGAFERAHSFRSDTYIKEYVKPDHDLTKGLAYERAALGVKNSSQVATAAPATHKFERKKSITAVDGKTSRYSYDGTATDRAG